MSEDEKKRQRIYDLLHAETKAKFLCPIQSKETFLLQKKYILNANRGGVGWSRELNKNEKKAF